MEATYVRTCSDSVHHALPCAPPLFLFLFLSLTESTCLELGPDAYTHPSSFITRSPAPALSLSLSLATHAVVRSSSLLVSLSLTLTPRTDVRTRTASTGYFHLVEVGAVDEVSSGVVRNLDTPVRMPARLALARFSLVRIKWSLFSGWRVEGGGWLVGVGKGGC